MINKGRSSQNGPTFQASEVLYFTQIYYICILIMYVCVCDLVSAVRFDFFEAKRRDLLAAARRAREHLVTETKENQNQQLAMATW